MKIPKNKKIEKCVYQDSSRLVLQQVNLERIDPSNGRLVSTDGRVLSVIHVDLDAKDQEGMIDAKHISAARSVTKQPKKSNFHGGVDVHLSAHRSMIWCHSKTNQKDFKVGYRREKIENGYPNWKIIAKSVATTKHHRVSFNAAFLKRISDSLGTDSVELIFSKDSNEPILVLPENRDSKDFAILMPLIAKEEPRLDEFIKEYSEAK